MVEIAISLGVIGFALVAIVGLLPRGLNAQRDNRQDTIVNQDGAYLLECIRGGIRGIDDLTNYVDYIVVTSSNRLNSTPIPTTWTVPNRSTVPGTPNCLLTNGQIIVGLLSTNRYMTNRMTTNDVVAYMWAMGGSAMEQGGSNRLVAFKYRVHPLVVRFPGYSYVMTNFTTNQIDLGRMNDEQKIDNLERSNNWLQARQLTNNLYNVSLEIAWPLKPNDAVVTYPKRRFFRTFVNANQDTNGIFQPQQYTYVP